jgi:hypothetical protein
MHGLLLAYGVRMSERLDTAADRADARQRVHAFHRATPQTCRIATASTPVPCDGGRQRQAV